MAPTISGSAAKRPSPPARTSCITPWARDPIGSKGDFIPGQSFTLVYNENYYGPEPDIKRIEFKIQPDTNTAVISLQNGEVDFVPALTVNDIAIVDGDENLKLYQAPSYTIHYICFNKTAEPFSIKEVREAINYAINKQDLLDGAVDGVGTIANSPLNSMHLGYNDSIPFNEYDLDAAKEKLEQAGYPDGFSCTLMVNSNNAVSMKIAQILQNQLAQINIDVKVEQLEKATWNDNLDQGQLRDFAVHAELGGHQQHGHLSLSLRRHVQLRPRLSQSPDGRDDRNRQPHPGYQ